MSDKTIVDLDDNKIIRSENISHNSNNLKDSIGNLENLSTTTKSNLVGALNEVYKNNIYSTTEQIVGKWKNGKSLYSKTIEGQITSYGEGNYPHITTSISNLKEVINIEYIFNYGSNYEYYSSTNLNMYLSKESNNDIVFISPENPGKITITIYYTKATD